MPIKGGGEKAREPTGLTELKGEPRERIESPFERGKKEWSAELLASQNSWRDEAMLYSQRGISFMRRNQVTISWRMRVSSCARKGYMFENLG